jgi:hypothetical protein
MMRMGWLLPLVVLGVTACTDDGAPAPTTELPRQTFVQQVVPILVQSCTASACHSGPGTTDPWGIDFMDYDTVAGMPELNDLSTSWLVYLPPQHAGGKNILNAADQQVILDWLYTLHGELAPN